ncbi:MAG: hypothetical protein KAI55_04950 [Candidatus Aenigmarchaeota archaeon]|nr:hypothetical protein [Candidatus Aenigmarchaeota archaeon]
MNKKLIILTVILFLILVAMLFLYDRNPNPLLGVDEKYHCQSDINCIDACSCMCDFEGDTCVNYEWWGKNIGYPLDCEPDPNPCKCVNNKCVTK